jgi:hypothetical protein
VSCGRQMNTLEKIHTTSVHVSALSAATRDSFSGRMCAVVCSLNLTSLADLTKFTSLADTRLADSTKCCRKSFLTSSKAHKFWEEVVQCSVCRECWGRMGNKHPALSRRRSCPQVPAREASERCRKVFLPASRPAICPASKSGHQAGPARGQWRKSFLRSRN